jgi:hypothetical protein
MQRRAFDILGERIFLGEDGGRGIAHHAGHRGGLAQALLLHQKLQRPVAAAAGGNLEHAGLLALGVEDGADVEALDEAAAGDRGRKVVDRDASFHAPHVRLAQHQLVEGNVARGRQPPARRGSCR